MSGSYKSFRVGLLKLILLRYAICPMQALCFRYDAGRLWFFYPFVSKLTFIYYASVLISI